MIKNILQDICVAVCLQNGDRVKNILTVACVAACFKNGDLDDKSLV